MTPDLSQHSPEVLLKALEKALLANRPHFCSQCGTNVNADDAIERDGFRLDPVGPVTYQGREIKLTKVQRCILSTFAYSHHTRVTAQILADRCCHLNGGLNAIRLHLTFLRRNLEAQGVPVPFRNERDVGYYWDSHISL